jgi:tRNA G37 N-methylase TrmD
MYRAITSIETEIGKTLRKIYLGPRGKRLVQPDCEKLSQELSSDDFIILCGHYE